MAGEKKPQVFTSFNAGEYSSKLAGRVDLDSFGNSARHISNFMAEVTGGLKKFYGTNHVVQLAKPNGLLFIPFINKYEPIVLVVTDGNMGLITSDTYKTIVDFKFPDIQDYSKVRFKQLNDKVFFVTPEHKQFSIDFLGVDSSGAYRFTIKDAEFIDVPYFPIGWDGNYNGQIISNGVSDRVTITVPSDTTLVLPMPSPLLSSSSFNIVGNKTYLTAGYAFEEFNTNLAKMTVSLIRIRAGVESNVITGIVGGTKITNTKVLEGYMGISRIITRTDLLNFFKQYYPEAIIISEKNVQISIPAGHTAGDIYRIKFAIPQSTSSATKPIVVIDGYNYVNSSPAIDYYGDKTAPEYYNIYDDVDNIVGRKIKVHMSAVEGTTITPWWQAKSVTANAINFSNGHYYRALSSGTTGNVQPNHTKGDVSDGGIVWRYLHSGTASMTIVSIESSTSLTAVVDEGTYLPILTWGSATYYFDTFQWSIWGYKGVFPSEVYMFQNRLGFITNTDGFGAWNALSCTDDYFNYSTEEFGIQLDTSACVNLITNNPDNQINWVLSGKRLYMGGYTAEFNIMSQTGIITPTDIKIDRVSEMGGAAVEALKYKDLNLFVGSNGDTLQVIGYDYTTDDYVPKSLSYFASHLLDKGIKKLVGVNNKDHNVYITNDDDTLTIMNYVGDQKILGFSQLDLDGDVLGFVSTISNNIKAAYVAVNRDDSNFITIERVAFEEPNYMLDTITSIKDNKSTTQIDTSSITTGIVNGFTEFVYNNLIVLDGGKRVLTINLGDIKENTDYVWNGSDFPLVQFSPIKLIGGNILAVSIGSMSGTALMYSTDNGATWTTSAAVESLNTHSLPGFFDYVTIASTPDGKTILMASASLEAGNVTLISKDSGVTFNVPEFQIRSVDYVNGRFISGEWAGADFIYKESIDGIIWNQLYVDSSTALLDGGFRKIYYVDDHYIIVGSKTIFIANKDFSEYTQLVTFAEGIRGTALLNDRLFIRKKSVSNIIYYDGLVTAPVQHTIDDVTITNTYDTIATDGNLLYVLKYNISSVIPTMGVTPIDKLYTEVNEPVLANKSVYVRYGTDLSQFIKTTLDADGKYTLPVASLQYSVGIPLVCELHTQASFGRKLEGQQQQSIEFMIRLNESGAFGYGTSNDFTKYMDFSNWGTTQNYSSSHTLFTGDARLNVPEGYLHQANVGDSQYPNDTGVGINIKCETPEPVNILSIQEVYK